MDFEGTGDNELEQMLLKYIDSPYFKNNPSYIALWQRYYEKTRDPRILFLMRHKKISKYYHWIYIELSRFFISKNHLGVCSVLLKMGIKCNAYDPRILEDELAKLPATEKMYFEHEINLLLNPKGFVALGRTWNSYIEALFYDRRLFIVENEELSFEERRSMVYKERLTKESILLEERASKILVKMGNLGDFQDIIEVGSNSNSGLHKKLKVEDDGNKDIKSIRIDDGLKSSNEVFEERSLPISNIKEDKIKPDNVPGDTGNTGLIKYNTESILKDPNHIEDLELHADLCVIAQCSQIKANDYMSLSLEATGCPKILQSENTMKDDAVTFHKKDEREVFGDEHDVKKVEEKGSNSKELRATLNDKPTAADTMKGSLCISGELVIDGFVFHVLEVVSRRKYRLMRIAKERMEGQTITAKDFLLHEVSKATIASVSSLGCFWIPSFTIEVLGSKRFLLCDYYQLGSLRRCLGMSGGADPDIILHFIDQLMEIFNTLRLANYALVEFSLDSICVTEECDLKLVDFDWKPYDASFDHCVSTLNSLSEYADVFLGKGDKEIQTKIKNDLKKINIRQAILKYKMRLYEKMYGI